MFSQLSDENKKTRTPTNMNNQNSSINNNIKNESILDTSKISNDNQLEIDNNIESLMNPSGSKEKKIYHVQNKNHHCMYNYQKDLEEKTSALSDYILNNEETKSKYYCYPNIKLLGNSRYKYTNPLLFVEDQKNNISSRSLGLLPIPLEKFHKKVKNEKDEKEGKNLYELQRSIVMFRRRQYNDHYEKRPNKNKNRDNIFTDLYDLDISNKKKYNKSYINKIILIQKWWRNILLQKYLEEYNNYINEFEKQLQIILMKMALKKLKDLLMVKQILKKYCYIEKKRYKYSYNDFIEAIKKIQNNYRIFKAKNLRKSLEKNLKENNNIQDNDNINQNSNNEEDNNSNLNKNENEDDDNFFNDVDYEDNNKSKDNNNNNINKENNTNNDNDDNKNNDDENNYDENNDNENNYNDDNKNKDDNINDNAINNENYKLDNNNNTNQNNNMQSNDKDIDNLENNNLGNYNSHEVDDNKNDIDNEMNNNKNDNINTNTNMNNLKDKDKDKNLDNIKNNKENDLNNKNKNDDTIPSKRNSKVNQNNNIFVSIKDDTKNKNNLKEKDKINNNNNLDNNKSKEPTKKRDSKKDNLKKIISFNNILNKCFHYYTFKKIKSYISEPTANIPLIKKCYLTKENIIILYTKKQEKKIIQFENIIEKTELQINVKNNYIEKIYKKPIINGNSFKYQYCFSNNPHSYMNVCYIHKIRINEYLRHLIKLQRKIKSFLLSKKYENFSNDDDPNESFNGQITHRNNLSEKATKRKYSKDNENNDSMNSFKKNNQEINFSFEKSNQESKRNSKSSFNNISDNQKNVLNFNTINDIKENENNDNNNINDYIRNKNSIMKINKNFKKGYFISKLIFKQTKDEIIKLQKNLKEREASKGKEHIFKKPSYDNVRKLNNNNNYNHDSDNFDTQSIKATIVFNSDRKKSFKDGLIYYSNSSNDKTNSPKFNKKNINNNNIPKNDLNNNNPIHDQIEIRNENSMNAESESLSDSNVFTKIKINCSSDEEKQEEDNFKEVTHFDYEDNNENMMKKTSSEVFYITKERRKDFMKYISKIQNFYKIYFNSKKSNKNHIYINTYRKPKIKSCIISIRRIVKGEEEKLYIYNPKIKYFLYLINLFVKKNVQEFIFEKIKLNKNGSNNKDCHGMPFYIRTIQRVMKYLQKKNNCNKKVLLFFNEIFNFKNKKISLLHKLCTLPKKERTKLIFSNLFTGYEENELINFICDFSQYDKNLNNESFITKRLIQSKLNDTNIFTLIRIIDKEYENLVEGVYCLKCFNNVNLCICRPDTQRYFDNYENKNSINNNNNNNNSINIKDVIKKNNNKENNDNNDDNKNNKINNDKYNNKNDNNNNDNSHNKIEENDNDDKNAEEEDDDDDFQTLDIDLNDDEDEDFKTKRKINYFDYNTNENIGGNILIKTKSKVNKNDNKKLLDIVI